MANEGPRGPDAVRQALVDAAARLFSERGPSNVSVREVARAARVNHGLVHTYFGAKDGLLAAVLEHLGHQAAERVGSSDGIDSLFEPDNPARRHGRILAYLILEGRDPSAFKTTFPTLDALVDRMRQGGLPAREARQRAVQLTALVLGWQFFEPFLSAAAGLRVSGTGSRKMLDSAVDRLIPARQR